MKEAIKRDRPLLPVDLAQLMFTKIIGSGDLVIDATAGNGHDTLFLAEAVGPAGRVLAFDVQAGAIAATRAKIEAVGVSGRVMLYQESHRRMGDHVAADSVSAVMFNLGYLPGADHSFATGDDTLDAIETAVKLIKPGGALSVICYPGHEGGGAEAAAVEARMARLGDDKWRVVKYQAIGTLKAAPFLLFAVRP